MLRLVSDEDFSGKIVRGLRRRAPHLDLVRVQDVGLYETPDPEVLEWAAKEGRVLLTQDINTMVGSAWDRVNSGQPMPGVIARKPGTGIGQAIEDILLIAECSTEDEIKDRIEFIPL
jgi:hypothetical protein